MWWCQTQCTMMFILLTTTMWAASGFVYGKRACRSKCCEGQEVATSRAACARLSIAQRWLCSPKKGGHQVRRSKNSGVVDWGFIRMLGILDVEVLWKVIGTFALSSRRFQWKGFQIVTSHRISVPATWRGISVERKGSRGVLCHSSSVWWVREQSWRRSKWENIFSLTR